MNDTKTKEQRIADLLMRTANNDLLIAMADGEVSMVDLARSELAARNIDKRGNYNAKAEYEWFGPMGKERCLESKNRACEHFLDKAADLMHDSCIFAIGGVEGPCESEFEKQIEAIWPTIC